MRGYAKRMHRGLRLTSEDDAARLNYLQIQSFTNQIKISHTLTNAQKSALWKQARDGDLEGAMKNYARLVTVRGVEVN